MNKALLAGITGMKNHQVRMNVVGNNISNVNTTGYKGARVNFQDTLYQTIKGAGESTNPAQTGVGSVVGSIDSIMTSGGLQSTGRTLDLAINGNGFFKVMNPLDGKEYYTREGLFYIDKEGYVVNSNGYRLIGDLRTITTVTSQSDKTIKVEDLSANDTVATATGTKEYAVITPEETDNSTQMLTLQGTLSNGKAGSSYDFIIDPVQRASFGTNEDYMLKTNANTSLSEIGFETGDLMEFTLTNKYGNDIKYTFEVINSTTQTVADLQDALAKNTDNQIQMYFTNNGQMVTTDELNGNTRVAINFGTASLGPGVNLKVKNLNNPSFVLNTNENGVSGTGDDIDTIVAKINEKTALTGIKALNVNDCLQLSTEGKGENAIMQVYGNAAKLLGLPMAGKVDFSASAIGTIDYARISPDSSDAINQTLTLQGTLADGSEGESHDFVIETAKRATVQFDQKTLNASSRLGNLGFENGDQLWFAYDNSYQGLNNITFNLTINLNQTVSDLQKQFAAKAKEMGIDEAVEMYFTDGGNEVEQSFLDFDGDEGIAFKTTDFGPGVSIAIKTLNSNGEEKELFSGIQQGTGDDVDDIVERVNAQTNITGVVASTLDNKLVLKTVGKGEAAILKVSGNAANLLGLPVESKNNTAATISGNEVYPRITTGEAGNVNKLSLYLQGTLANGSQSALTPIEIETAEAAEINAGNNYTFDENTTIEELGFELNDVIKVEYQNEYTGMSNNFSIKIDNIDFTLSTTIEEIRQAFNDYAAAANIDAEMYYTQDGNEAMPGELDKNGDEGIAFRTSDYGPGVNLTVTTMDGDGDLKEIFTEGELASGTFSQTGTGDGIDEIIAKINAQTFATGIIASNVDNKLVLNTVGSGENATLGLAGEAAYYLGFQVADNTYSLTAASANDLVNVYETGKDSVNLSLQSVRADGSYSSREDIAIDTAKPAEINAGEFYSDPLLDGTSTLPLNDNTTLEAISSAGADDKLIINYMDKDNNMIKKSITINSGTTLGGLKGQIEAETGGLVTLEYTDNKVIFKTVEGGPGVSLSITTTDIDGKLKNIFEDSQSQLANVESKTDQNGFVTVTGTGSDLNEIVDKINAVKDSTGVLAKNVDDHLVLETIGKRIEISGEAAAMLGLQSGTVDNELNSTTPAVAGSSEELSFITEGETSSADPTILKLQGVREDGSIGTVKEISIDPAIRANIDAFKNIAIGSNDVTSDVSTVLGATVFAMGDLIEFTIQNKYDGTIENFRIALDDGTNFNTLQDIQDKILADSKGQVEMYFTDDGKEVDSLDLDGNGNEGISFRTTAYGPGVSLSISTKDNTGALKEVKYNTTEIFAGNMEAKVDGSGDDINSIVDKINTVAGTPDTAKTGLKAKIVDNRLVLETVGKGEDAILSVNGDAAELLGLAPIVYNGATNYVTFNGSSDYEAVFDDNTKPAGIYNGTSDKTATLTLRGTKYDGTDGEETDFNINAAEQAVINAGENYNIDANTKMSSFGFSEGDKIEFTIKKADNSEGSKKITIEVNNTQTLKDFQNALYAQASSQGLDNAIEMYYTSSGIEADFTSLDGNGDEGFGFRTADFGPNITLSIVVKDQNDNSKSMFDGTNSDFIVGAAEKSGTGDDIDSIISKINNETEVTGVIASKDADNRLVLRTSGDSEDATLFVDGDAASYLGLPSGVRNNEGVTVTSTLKLKGQGVSTLSIDGMGTINGTDNSGTAFEWEGGDAITDAGVAQIALYNFANQDGLLRVNNGMFLQSASTGREIKGDAGSNGFGTIESGNLEMSNVDLTEEFSNMIITQRGYQANARVVTVSDSMLEELLNLKR